MKQYLLAVHMVEGDPVPPPEEMQQAYERVEALNAEIKSAGAWVFAGGLHPADTATVVRAGDGKVVTTDGSFAETKEQLAGFWLIRAPDLDAALEWAAKGSAACGGPAEGREMARWADLEALSSVDVYFAEAHHPWQRPSNENGNGLLRRYVDFETGKRWAFSPVPSTGQGGADEIGGPVQRVTAAAEC